MLLGLLLLALVPLRAAAAAQPIDFAGPAAVIDLKDRLMPYHAPSGAEVRNSRWYMLTAVNSSVRPATRVLLVGQPSDVDMRVWPLSARPYIQQVAASDSQVIVEDARAHGRHAFRVTIPPATSITLAIRVAYGDPEPSVIAWTEPALVSYNRQMAVLLAAVAASIAAATAITLGLAVMTGHPAPAWASLLLGLIFALRLAVTGTLDSGWGTQIGGPFGLEVALAGLALAVGLRLTDVVVPFRSLSPRLGTAYQGALWAVAAFSFLAFLGVPGAMLLTDSVIVLGTTAIWVYFGYCGWKGDQAARVALPSAAIFALVAYAATAMSLIGFPANQAAPAFVGGFTAAGAVLLALAVAAGEGIAALPASQYGAMPFPNAVPPNASVPPKPSPAAALQAIGAAHQGVFDLDLATERLRLSQEAAALIGLAGEISMPHATFIERVHPEDRSVYREAIGDYCSHTGIAFRLEFRARSESGRYPWFELRATMTGERHQAERCLGLLADVTSRKESDAQSAERNIRDTLTGLGNRVALMELLDRLGPHLASAALAILDIDRFRSVQSSLGGDGADALLVSVAQRLARRLGGNADIFRAGGDAFALVFSGSAAEPSAIGADLIEVCAEPFEHRGRNVFVSASAGVAAGQDARDPLELVKNAELALFHAKRQGGACARIYSRMLETSAPGDAVALEADLREALKQQQLDVYYQPIMRLSDGSVAGFEALLRWRHPEKGLIEPSHFVAHCEETGLIVAMGRLALERASQDLDQWQHFFPLKPPLFASVNLSRRQLLDAEFEVLLDAVLKKHDVVPGTLKLEVTESAVANGTDLRPMLERLRMAGASLAIDDFGTGTSNFHQLKDIPFDTLKLDRSFLGRNAGNGGDANGGVILSTIVNLAHELDRDVVIEGIETKEEAEWLKTLGCEFGQGFYFSAPLPREEALDFIARHYNIEAGQA